MPVRLPSFLVRLIDPANGYFDRHTPRFEDGPVFQQAVVFGPGVPGGSRAATDEERAAFAEDAARHRGSHEAALAEARRRSAPQLEGAARELLATGATTIALGSRTVEARLVSFWHGDSVPHSWARGPDGNGENLARISRNQLRDTEVLVDYLAHAATEG